MDARKEIRGSICGIQKSDHADKDGVLSSVQHRTQHMSVGIDRGYGKKDCHACKEKGTQSVVIVFVLKKEKDHSGSHIGKPKEIGDDEIFAERNVIIHCHVDHVHVAHGF